MLQQYFRNGVAQGLYDPDHESAPGVPLTTPTANGQGNPQQGQAGNPAPNAQPGGMDPAMAAMLAQQQALQQAQQRQGGVGGQSQPTGGNAPMSLSGGMGGNGASPGMPGSWSGMGNAQGVISPGAAGGMAMRAGQMFGPVGMGLAAAAGLGIKANNLYSVDRNLAANNLPELGLGQSIGAMLPFGNGYASGAAGEARAYRNQVAQTTDDPSVRHATMDNLEHQNTMMSLPQIEAARQSYHDSQGDGGQSYSGTGGGDGQSGGSSDTAMSHAGFASGGLVQGGQNGAVPTRGAAARPGLVAGRSPGQADALNRAVPQGSFIVPASVVSALGQGNTAAGAAALHSMMTPAGPKAGGLQPQPMSMAGPQPGMSGGHGGNVRTQLSGGEFEITPQQLAALMANPQGAQLLKTIMGAMPKPAPQQQPGQMPPQQPMPPPMQGQGQGQGQPPPQGPPPQGPPQ